MYVSISSNLGYLPLWENSFKQLFYVKTLEKNVDVVVFLTIEVETPSCNWIGAG